ncbi:MAG: hypothetical protein EU548_01725, partial [Promethearchaeota archaeon]
MAIKKIYKINEFLTLKLEDRKTKIYVKNNEFRTCKFLLLVDPNGVIGGNINSIDEAAEKYDDILEGDEFLPEEFAISPEQEFWAHCSNLQAWAENKYNINLIHSNLAFPLLVKLIKVGDLKARICFEEQIFRAFLELNFSIIKSILYRDLLDLLDEEKLKSLKIELKEKNPDLAAFFFPVFLRIHSDSDLEE